MGSFKRNFGKVEARNEPSTTPILQTTSHLRAQDREKPPVIKKGMNKSLENDINKIFEAVNLRETKSMDVSILQKKASKRSARITGSPSPGIGFAKTVSLKQALRRQCISQAAEMAAMKRLSMTTASPRFSEVSRITNLYKSAVFEAGESACALTKDGQSGITVSFNSCSSDAVPQDSIMKLTSQSSDSPHTFDVKTTIKSILDNSSDSCCHLSESSDDSVLSTLAEEEIVTLEEPKIDSLDQSECSSRFHISSVVNGAESSLLCHDREVSGKSGTRSLEKVGSVEETCSTASAPNSNVYGNFSKMGKKISSSIKLAGGPSMDSATSLKASSKRAPKLKRKTKALAATSSGGRNNREIRLTRNTSRSAKGVPTRNRNLVIKKSKKAVVSTYGSRKKNYEVNSVVNHSSGQLICQKCQCLLDDSNKVLPEATGSELFTGSKNSGEIKLDYTQAGWENRGIPLSKANKTAKCEKGDISRSLGSSVCEFSSTTITSISEDSYLNGSICGDRPHMSRDKRWEAINHIGKHGFLGLSHFNLLKKLGSGDIGTVYLAELIGTNYLFAIKVMDNEYLARRKKMPRAHTEREILQMLDHPFLPTLYAQFTSDNLSCLVMEFCPGGDLHVLRQKQPDRYFSEHAARFYVAEVLLALEYLHMLGIVYRDLKPENILVGKDGHIMLTDFDLSLRCSVSPTLVKSSHVWEPPRVSGPCTGSNCIDPFCSAPSCKMSCFGPRFSPATARMEKLKNSTYEAQSRLIPVLVAEPTEARSNSFVGTHEYLAPEIIKGEGHGSPVDWWTLGVFLYELLYGKTPFKGAENDETMANVVLQSLKFPDIPIVSAQARDLIRALLVKDPEHRFGRETGAAEIKRHPFFEGLNWALIRSASPPEIPELCETRYPQTVPVQETKTSIGFGGTYGEHLKFELF